MKRTWTIGGNTFTWYDEWKNGVTTFPDGRMLTAAPNSGEADKDMARALGYTTDYRGLEAMCRDHELLHTFLAVREGLPYSPTLYSVALMNEGISEEDGRIATYEARCYEEWQVLALQKMKNEGGKSELALDWENVYYSGVITG